MFKASKDSLATSLDDIIQGLIKKVNDCLSIEENYLNMDVAFRDACVKREILTMVQEGSVYSTDSVQILISRIRSLLSSSVKEGRRGKKNKREELRLSKLDEWYLVQQHLVQEEKESKKGMARKRAEEIVKLQSERQELLKQINKKRLDQRRKKTDELRRVRESVKAAEREAAKEMEARQAAGQRLKDERQAQIKLERKKKEILIDLKRVVDEKEKQIVLESMVQEEQV